MVASPGNSPAEPDVTVVVGASAPEASLESCLAALEPQLQRAHVVVVSIERASESVRRRFPWAEFHARPGALVPALWRDGIERARGRIVALTIAQMIPAPDWVDTIIRTHEQHDAVGGAIDPGERLRRVDWAEYLCRYAREMAPFEERERHDIAGDNASYKRALLVEAWEHLRDGFWEPVIHPVLRQRGVGLWHTPAMLVRQGRSCGFAAFARQRSRHGRLYAYQRGGNVTRLRHAIGVLGSPLVPFLMTARVLQNVFAKKRYRAQAIAALPLVFALNAVWAFAEARGHLELVAAR
jgi:hypothetical protein